MSNGLISLFLFQANRQLDLACSIEITALRLKQSTLRSWNVALAGSACGHLLHVLEDLFSLPELEQSKKEEVQLQATTYAAAELESKEECAVTVVESGEMPPPLKHRKVLEMITQAPKTFKDKCTHISEASPYFPTSSIKVSITGVNEDLVEKPDEKLSVYHCVLCFYCAEQRAQLFTHVRHVHLSICIACRLCEYHTYRGVDMTTHLKKVHPNDEEDWLKPIPNLEGLSVDSAVHRECASLIKEEPTIVEDSD